MITEKTAQKREAAVLDSTKVYFDKLGNGLSYLKTQIEENNKYEKLHWQAVEDAIEIDRESRTRKDMLQLAYDKATQSKLDEYDSTLKTNIGKIELIMSKMNIKCEECGAFMSPVQIVCHKCGTFSHIFPYSINDSDKIKQITSFSISPLSNNLKSVQCEKAPYDEVQKEFDAISKIKSIAELYCTCGNSELNKASFKKIALESEEFLVNARNKSIEIAIVGNVKAGKSMLINALLGDRMAI